MRYMLLIYGDERVWTSMPESEKARMFAEHEGYADDLRREGKLVLGAPLEPTWKAITVRGELTTDGPFAETKEQLGGFYLIEAASVEEAASWAARMPGSDSVSIEVRPCSSVR